MWRHCSQYRSSFNIVAYVPCTLISRALSLRIMFSWTKNICSKQTVNSKLCLVAVDGSVFDYSERKQQQQGHRRPHNAQSTGSESVVALPMACPIQLVTYCFVNIIVACKHEVVVIKQLFLVSNRRAVCMRCDFSCDAETRPPKFNTLSRSFSLPQMKRVPIEKYKVEDATKANERTF